jgi:hypothetical protein
VLVPLCFRWRGSPKKSNNSIIPAVTLNFLVIINSTLYQLLLGPTPTNHSPSQPHTEYEVRPLLQETSVETRPDLQPETSSLPAMTLIVHALAHAKFPIRSHNWKSPCHVPFRCRNHAPDFRNLVNLMTSRPPMAVYQNAALVDQFVFHGQVHVISPSVLVAQAGCTSLTMSRSHHVFHVCLSVCLPDGCSKCPTW